MDDDQDVVVTVVTGEVYCEPVVGLLVNEVVDDDPVSAKVSAVDGIFID